MVRFFGKSDFVETLDPDSIGVGAQDMKSRVPPHQIATLGDSLATTIDMQVLRMSGRLRLRGMAGGLQKVDGLWQLTM